MISLAGFTPEELGLPADKFPQFRDIQIEAIEQIANGEKRFQALCLPTGSGKSLVAMGAGKATASKTVILTATKGLQSQYLADGEQAGMKDIRGKSNYPCADKIGQSCRFGPLEGCRMTNGNGCTYESARAEALASDLVVTNYDYWIRANEKRNPLVGNWSDQVELLILDEAHSAESKLSGCLGIKLRESWLREASLRYNPSESIDVWANMMAKPWIPRIEEDLKEATKDFRKKSTKKLRDRVYVLEELLQSLERISMMREDSWVCEMRQGTQWGRVWDFDCVWPGQWAEQRLFCGVAKVVLMSATLRPAAMGMLGIKKGDYEFREWDRIFPAQNTPVYHIPTVRMNHKIDEDGLDKWVRRIDEIIESRLDRKGIIHTVSFQRQKYLLDKSKFSRFMLSNTSEPDSLSATEIRDSFQQSSAPSILVSPSFSTGWDFPGRSCEWQIIAKVPYPYSKTKVMQARLERNPRYADYLAMQDMIQAAGRGSRSADDRCEVFCIDDLGPIFMWKNKGLKPDWFQMNTVSEIPPPGPRAPISKSLAPDWEAGSTHIVANGGDLEW